MDVIDELCFNVRTWRLSIIDEATYSLFWYTYSFIWIIGMLGNLANIVVFNHELMSKSYLISLLYWLATCDFLELFLFFVLFFLNNFDFSETYTIFSINSKMIEDPVFYVFFLLFTLHNTSILLNITLAIVQYLMIVHPFRYKQLFSGNRPSKRMVNGIFFIGIIISYLFLSSSLHYQGQPHPDAIIGFNKSGNAYVKEHNYGNISGANENLDSMCRDAMNRRDDIFKLLLFSILRENKTVGESLLHLYGSAVLQKYNATTLAKFPSIEELDPYGRIDMVYGHFESFNYRLFITISSSIIVRIGLLLVLMITSIRLIYGSIRASRIQRELRGSTSRITDQVTNRMTNVTVLILFIFSITEIPFVAYSLYYIPFNTSLQIQMKILISHHRNSAINTEIFGIYGGLNMVCYNVLYVILNDLIVLCLLVSSSYTIFCYLIMSAQYRDILKYVLRNIFIPPTNIPTNTQQTNIELIPLRTPTSP